MLVPHAPQYPYSHATRFTHQPICHLAPHDRTYISKPILKQAEAQAGTEAGIYIRCFQLDKTLYCSLLFA